MREVSDAFLLEVAGIAASLLGFFVVGVFFYVQRGMFPNAADQARRYLQAATRTVILLYGMTLLLSLALVVLGPQLVSLIYAALSVLLLGSVSHTSVAIRRLHEAVEIRVMSQLGMWSAAAAIIGLPWILGGSNPTRQDLTLAIALIGIFAFTSSASLVLSTFDISRLEARAIGRADQEDAPTRPTAP